MEVGTPKRYFLVKGKGVSRVSFLNSFDNALLNAKIGDCNLIYVSSIIPENCVEVDSLPNLNPGTIIYVVMSRKDGMGPDKIVAGIGVARIKVGSKEYGFIAEDAGVNEREVRQKVINKLNEMAKSRNAKILDIKTEIEALEVPSGFYGTVIAAVVFLP